MYRIALQAHRDTSLELHDIYASELKVAKIRLIVIIPRLRLRLLLVLNVVCILEEITTTSSLTHREQIHYLEIPGTGGFPSQRPHDPRSYPMAL
jgi:hypothetical protein